MLYRVKWPIYREAQCMKGNRSYNIKTNTSFSSLDDIQEYNGCKSRDFSVKVSDIADVYYSYAPTSYITRFNTLLHCRCGCFEKKIKTSQRRKKSISMSSIDLKRSCHLTWYTSPLWPNRQCQSTFVRIGPNNSDMFGFINLIALAARYLAS